MVYSLTANDTRIISSENSFGKQQVEFAKSLNENSI